MSERPIQLIIEFSTNQLIISSRAPERQSLVPVFSRLSRVSLENLFQNTKPNSKKDFLETSSRFVFSFHREFVNGSVPARRQKVRSNESQLNEIVKYLIV